MIDVSKYPARVGRGVAMALLGVATHKMFSKIVEAHDSKPGLDAAQRLAHKLPGEGRAKYRVEAIALLLNPPPQTAATPRRATRGEGKSSL
jgi:hypothetical protein